jgi:hypothetical protein
MSPDLRAMRQLPDPLDGVELRAVRREEEEPQHLPVRREERGESAGMVVRGVIQDGRQAREGRAGAQPLPRDRGSRGKKFWAAPGCRSGSAP